MAASSKAVNDLYKLITGNIEILSIQALTLNDPTTVGDKGAWSATKTFNAVSGATGYLTFPVYCNFGFVTGINRNGTTITVKAINGSGESHTCMIGIIVIAYK